MTDQYTIETYEALLYSKGMEDLLEGCDRDVLS